MIHLLLLKRFLSKQGSVMILEIFFDAWESRISLLHLLFHSIPFDPQQLILMPFSCVGREPYLITSWGIMNIQCLRVSSMFQETKLSVKGKDPVSASLSWFFGVIDNTSASPHVVTRCPSRLQRRPHLPAWQVRL